MTAAALFDALQHTDETTRIEAKRAGQSTHSVLETICAFANEPDLEGGWLLLGVEVEDETTLGNYRVRGITDSDKLQSDLASQCASMFNLPIRPQVSLETLHGKQVAVIRIKELPAGQKPLFFASEGLPRGAYRRIGPTDQRCTEDDMTVFYNERDTYDRQAVDYTSIADVEPRALQRYRALRGKAKPSAEELTFDDVDLLRSLRCIEPGAGGRLTVAGVLLFGTSRILRREFPMMRVDYIRVPGTRWMEAVGDEFTTIEFREALITMLPRIVSEVQTDIPRTFSLEEGKLQATYKTLPERALREVITNALMHRNYRKHSAIQVIRYDNRLEVKNAGFSLKPEERFGIPGSETRNPSIANVFHDTNLAETKGSGIRRMRTLLAEAGFGLPTFESSRSEDSFTARLLLHHLLEHDDLGWLSRFGPLALNEQQRRMLVFLREVGAIDRVSFRQFTGATAQEAADGLKGLLELGMTQQRGKGRGTYYVPGPKLLEFGALPMRDVDSTDSEADSRDKGPNSTDSGPSSTDSGMNSTHSSTRSRDKGPNSPGLGANSPGLGANSPGLGANSPGLGANSPGLGESSTKDLHTLDMPGFDELEIYATGLRQDEPRGRIVTKIRYSEEMLQEFKNRPGKASITATKVLILKLCEPYALPVSILVHILDRSPKYIQETYLKGMVKSGQLVYLYPEMPNHPRQAYWTNRAEP